MANVTDIGGDGIIASAPTYNIPNQLLSETDKFANGGKWFYENIQWICSFYNRPTQNVLSPDLLVEEEMFSPAVKMLQYILYYQGRQPNLNYKWLTQNVTGSNLQAMWRKGQDIAPIIDKMRGDAYRALNNIHFSCRPLSEDANSKRTRHYNALMVAFKMKEELKSLASLGVRFEPVAGREFNSEQEIDDYMENEYKDYGAMLATDISASTWATDYMLPKMLKNFDYANICGLAGVEHIVENGRYTAELIPPYQAIVDRRIDDDFNRKAQFAGVIRNLSVGEVFSRFPYLPQTTKEDIMKMAQDDTLFKSYNTAQNFNWWVPGTANGMATVSVASVYFKCTRTLDKRVAVNKYGIEALLDIKDREFQVSEAKKKLNAKKISKDEYNGIVSRLQGDFVIEDVYKASLIGNKWLTDYGYHNNVSENPITRETMLPIQFWLPNMIGGDSRSTVSRLEQIQDEVDSYRFQIKEMVGRAKGKVWFIRGGALGNSTTAREILQDIAAAGGTVLADESGEIETSRSGKIVETADLTLDPNFINLHRMIMELKTEMMEVASTSKIAMGQQTSYIGATTQHQTIAQSSTGQAPILEGFLDYVSGIMQYSLNIRKNLFAKYPNSLSSGVNVGDKGVMYFDEVMSENLVFEDFLLFLHVKDVIDLAARERMIQYAQAWSQNPAFGVSPLDIIRLEKATTFTQATTILEESLRKSEAKSKERESMVAQMEQLRAEQQAANVQMVENVKALAKQFTDISKIDREGLWKMREAEYKATLDSKTDPALESAPAMPGQQQSPQPTQIQ